MFKRALSPPPKQLVHNGKFAFGTYDAPSELLDIRGARRPFFNLPTFSFFTNFRIKCSVTYIFRVAEYLGYINIFDDKVFGLAEVVIWRVGEATGAKRVAYHALMPLRRRIIPFSTQKASVLSFASTRYIKISWNRAKMTLSVAFVMKGDRWRRASKGKFFLSMASSKTAEVMAVNPAPTAKRCTALWAVFGAMTGGVSFARHRKQIKGLKQEAGEAILTVRRTYLRWHTRKETLWGVFNNAGRGGQFTLTATSQDATEGDVYNENFLVLEGALTALPGVFITHPYGIEKTWVIQDTENMIDLTFTPVNLLKRVFNVIIMRNAYTLIEGKINGVLVTKDGDRIELKDCDGIIKKSLLRL